MEKYSFFNSIAGDRKYSATNFAEYFSKFVTTGIFPVPSNTLQVISNNDMTVTVKAGVAYINGYMYILDADLILPIDVADGVLKRIDRVVIKMDTIARNITAKVKKGTFASTPTAQALQRDFDAYELGIADIYIGNGVVSILTANITDTRYNTTLCGIVNNLFSDASMMAQSVSLADNLDYYNAANVEAALAEIRAPFNIYKSSIDANGVYKVVDYKRVDSTLIKKSTLSNPDANGYYLTQTINFYNSTGTTVVRTEVYTLSYDLDGNVVNEVKV